MSVLELLLALAMPTFGLVWAVGHSLTRPPAPPVEPDRVQIRVVSR